MTGHVSNDEKPINPTKKGISRGSASADVGRGSIGESGDGNDDDDDDHDEETTQTQDVLGKPLGKR